MQTRDLSLYQTINKHTRGLSLCQTINMHTRHISLYQTINMHTRDLINVPNFPPTVSVIHYFFT